MFAIAETQIVSLCKIYHFNFETFVNYTEFSTFIQRSIFESFIEIFSAGVCSDRKYWLKCNKTL